MSTSAVIDRVGQPPRSWLAIGGQLVREGRDECRAHRAFGEEVTDEVGDAEGDAERIHRVAGAEVVGQDLVADQPEDSAGHGRQAEKAGRTGQTRCGLGHHTVAGTHAVSRSTGARAGFQRNTLSRHDRIVGTARLERRPIAGRLSSNSRKKRAPAVSGSPKGGW